MKTIRFRILAAMTALAVLLISAAVVAVLIFGQSGGSGSQASFDYGLDSGIVKLNTDPMPSFMTVVGDAQGPIPGGVQQQGREGTIFVEELHHEIGIPPDPNLQTFVVQKQGVDGTRQHYPLKVTTLLDIATPKLYQALATAEPLSVQIDYYAIDPTGIEVRYFSMVLDGAQIVSMRPYIPHTLDPAMENFGHMLEVDFVYNTITYNYIENDVVVNTFAEAWLPTAYGCPDYFEDVDGYKDTDRCADPDNDEDGFPDATDDCPGTDWTAGPDGVADPTAGDKDNPLDELGVPIDTREDYDGVLDTDGCHDSPGDDYDGDGFTDEVEFFDLGTNPASACALTAIPNDEDPDPLPPDFDDNQVVNILDVSQVLPPYFGSSPGNPDTNGDGIIDWSPRWDMEPDGFINIIDVSYVLPPVFGTSCTP